MSAESAEHTVVTQSIQEGDKVFVDVDGSTEQDIVVEGVKQGIQSTTIVGETADGSVATVEIQQT